MYLLLSLMSGLQRFNYYSRSMNFLSSNKDNVIIICKLHLKWYLFFY